MKLLIAAFLLAVLSTFAASVGLALWDGHYRHRDLQLRAIHYDTQYDMSAQRRVPSELRR
ncbi:MAG: hypothetical protein K2Y27_22075 [Xanthobacteraceae bacterium]|nr:hypothetical protein [Xanthobacteraceae bacterium]